MNYWRCSNRDGLVGLPVIFEAHAWYDARNLATAYFKCDMTNEDGEPYEELNPYETSMKQFISVTSECGAMVVRHLVRTTKGDFVLFEVAKEEVIDAVQTMMNSPTE